MARGATDGGGTHGGVEVLVEVIARKVARQLQLAPTGDFGSDPSEPCDATDLTCNGCGFCTTRKEGVVDALVGSGASRFGAAAGGTAPRGDLASMIDHTLLKPDATREDLQKVCDEARQWHFATVCVNASNIPLAAKLLAGSGVKPIAVVGFPLGAMTGTAKAFEAREAVRNGAREIDMVINIGALKSRDYATVLDDICRVVTASRPYPVKVILETAGLSQDEKVIGCALSKAGGAAFVKTSTGFGPGGATVEDIQLMRRIVGEELGVKASGGVRTTDDAQKMMAAGADRIGASASIAIVTGGKSNSSY
ncbi:MAG: deoxyribose-phosphate aldolase [Deltaproteobacteria bacterium]|nr:deoxyribose-phosphate aldolase [Deltaproteobacteria bacterium]